MAWEHAYTSDHIDLLLRLKEIATGFPIVTTPVRSGVGDGIVYGLHTTAASTPAETWTLTCTNDLPPATFSVTGSVSGAQAAATVDTPYSITPLVFTITAGSIPFAVGDAFVFDTVVNPLVAATQTWEVKRWLGTGAKVVNYLASSTYGGTSTYNADKAIDGLDSTAWYSDPELGNDSWWQVEFDKAVDLRRLTIAGFNAQQLNGAPKNLEVLYSDDGVSFTVDTTITNQTLWQVGELRSFSLSGTAGAHKFWRIHITLVNGGTQAILPSLAWYDVNNSFNVGFYGDGYDTILRGHGTAGGDNIYISLRTDSMVHHGPNWVLDGSVGYASGLDSMSQPMNTTDGFISGSTPYPDKNRLTLYDAPFQYWITVSGRVIKVAARFQNLTEFAYLGFHLPYSLPSQYPYPLVVAGSQSAGNPIPLRYNWDRTDAAHSLVVNPSVPGYGGWSTDTTASPARVYTPYNVWKQIVNYRDTFPSSSGQISLSTWPFLAEDNNNSTAANVTKNTDEKWPMSAVVLLDREFDAQYGELDGVKHLPGIHAIESIINHEGEPWVILHNVFREQDNQFFALRLT